MYKYYNPHPKGLLTDDCAKRAICAVTGIAYHRVSQELNRYKAVTGASHYYSHQNPHRYVEDRLNGRRLSFSSKPTAAEFCHAHPRGRYILDMKGHWSAAVDGVLYDTWDCSAEAVNFAYAIDTPNYQAPDLGKQILRYCCTAEQVSPSETMIRIYDGNGQFSQRKIPAELAAGYLRCLQDSNYTVIL